MKIFLKKMENLKRNRQIMKFKYKIIINISFIVFVSALMFLICFFTMKQDDLKKSANKIINNVLVIECMFDDNSVSEGTGVLVKDNTIISVAHLFPQDKEIVSVIGKINNEEYLLEIKKIDYNLDLSLLYSDDIKGDLKIYNSSKLQYGDKIYKIGNSLGYGLSIDDGVISSPYKKININDVDRELIQISMQIYSGDSGAPVFNYNSELIGIVSFKTSTDINVSAELSFIIPANIVKKFMA